MIVSETGDLPACLMPIETGYLGSISSNLGYPILRPKS